MTRESHATPTPFWYRLRPIMLYPVRGAALYTLVALTLCKLPGMTPCSATNTNT